MYGRTVKPSSIRILAASREYGAILFYASTQRWDERRLGDRLLAAAIRDIGRDPAYVLQVGAWNTIRMFHLGELDFAVKNLRDTDIPRLPALLAIYGFYPLAILALAGIGTGLRRSVLTPPISWCRSRWRPRFSSPVSSVFVHRSTRFSSCSLRWLSPQRGTAAGRTGIRRTADCDAYGCRTLTNE